MESRNTNPRVIQEHIGAAIQFIGNWEATNPRICWQKQVSSFEKLFQLGMRLRPDMYVNFCEGHVPCRESCVQ